MYMYINVYIYIYICIFMRINAWCLHVNVLQRNSSVCHCATVGMNGNCKNLWIHLRSLCWITATQVNPILMYNRLSWTYIYIYICMYVCIHFFICLRLGHKQKMHRNACPGKRWATPLLESRALKQHLPAKTKQIRAIYWSKDLHRRSILVSTWWSHMLLWLTTASAIWASM